MQKQVRFGAVSFAGTPRNLPDYDYTKDHSQPYPKTPIIKEVPNENFSVSSNEIPVIELSPGKSPDSRSNGNHQVGKEVEQTECESIPRKNEPTLKDTVTRAPECGSGNPTYHQNNPIRKKQKTQYLKTTKKLIFKKVILREKVIHKAFKIIKTRDISTQTSP